MFSKQSVDVVSDLVRNIRHIRNSARSTAFYTLWELVDMEIS
jgi:hypothetical protein